MATLTKDNERDYELGLVNEIPIIAAEIIFGGAAVGKVEATGHARPLVSGDEFAGFAEEKVDNSAGSAADKNVRIRKSGAVVLSVSGAVITDKDQPVYANDDDTFVFSPVGNTFIGFIRRFVSSGKVIVAFDADNFKDPYAVYGAPGEYETKSAAYTIDILDTAKVIFVDTTSVITLPVVATGVHFTLVNIGAFGGVQISVNPAAADMIHAPDIAGTNDKDHINTLATAQRGDLVQLAPGDANGWLISNQKGTWAQEG